MDDVTEFNKYVLSNINKVLGGKVVLLDFLDENEGFIVESLCDKNGIPYYKNGGIVDSVRNRYLLSMYDIEDSDFKIVVYKIEYNKKYYDIEHKHVLGTLMSLGIQRKTIGDIVIDDNKDIYFSTTEEIAKYLKNELHYINHASIELKEVDYEVRNVVNYLEKEIMVSSYRLDAIISGVYNLSRSKSQELISEGLVYVNHVNNMNISHNVNVGDEINVRHYGKFKISEYINTTRSGRYKMLVLIWR